MELADGQFFLTMELVEGRPLAEALPKDGLSLDRLLKIAIPAGQGGTSGRRRIVASKNHSAYPMTTAAAGMRKWPP